MLKRSEGKSDINIALANDRKCLSVKRKAGVSAVMVFSFVVSNANMPTFFRFHAKNKKVDQYRLFVKTPHFHGFLSFLLAYS